MNDPTSKWESYIDEQIRKSLGDGVSTHLPGTGKPLKLDDPNTSDDMRMAYKIMRENDIAPDWIMDGKDLENEYARIQSMFKEAVRVYQTANNIARQTGNGLLEENAEAVWKNAQRRIREVVEQYNKRIFTYNLKIPAGIQHRQPINFEREVKLLLG